MTILLLVMISLASAGISFSITQAVMFMGLRRVISKIHPKLDQLIHCPWCTGHYVVLVWISILFRHTLLFEISPLLHFLLNWFTCVSLMGLFHYIILVTYNNH